MTDMAIIRARMRDLTEQARGTLAHSRAPIAPARDFPPAPLSAHALAVTVCGENNSSRRRCAHACVARWP
jgi:hypothetical protein